MVRSTFTVFFDDPFWVGVLERWDGTTLLMGRHVFGQEPSNAELTRFLLEDLHRMRLHPVDGGKAPPALVGGYKRRMRDARRDAARAPYGNGVDGRPRCPPRRGIV